MPTVFKQFGAKDIALSKDHFKLSLIKLTSLYVVILATILLISSGTIYSAFSTRLEHRFGNFQPDEFREQHNFSLPPKKEEVRTDLIISIALVNGILLALAAISSYGLAKWTLKPLQEAFDTQKRFLSDASHELRTPLSILKTDLENELGETPITAIQKHAQILSNLEEVEKMSKLIGDLLTLSRLDEIHLSKIQKSEVNITELLTVTAERFQALAKENQVSLFFSKPSSSIKIFTDLNLVSQALNNVVKNAILYNKEKGEVKIEQLSDKQHLKIIITDTGIGMSEKDLKNIFERFYRSDKSRSRQTGGSGLGLSIAKSSLENIGGHIYANSELGIGTKITIELPEKI
jgi:two-component system sensor histidine kinase CiaH